MECQGESARVDQEAPSKLQSVEDEGPVEAERKVVEEQNTTQQPSIQSE